MDCLTANLEWSKAKSAVDLVPRLEIDLTLADRFVTLCGKFTLTQGAAAGKRFEEVMLPWQKAMLHASFQCRETFLVVGKGSGKTVGIAAYAIAFVMLSHIRKINTRGLVAVVASSIPTARVCFDHIQHAILADDELRQQFKSNVQSRSITHISSGITIQILSCSMDAAVGRRPCLLIVDEMHEVSTIANHKPVIDQLRLGGRNWGSDFKTVVISTMPVGKLEGEFARLYNYGCKVRDGKVADNDFLPIMFTFPLLERTDLDPLDESQWFRGMPSLTTSSQVGTMDSEELRRELEAAAKAEDGDGFTNLLSQRLGIANNLRDEDAESILHSRWHKCPEASPIVPIGLPVVAGVDMGGIDDPAALCVLFERGGETYAIINQYLTQAGYKRATDSLRDVYDAAIKVGSLKLFDTIDDLTAAMVEQATQVNNNNRSSTVLGGDEHGVSGAKRMFEDAGLTFNSVPQTWVLGAALNALEGIILDRKLHHNHCPLAAENVRNLLIEHLPSGNKRLKKRDAGLSGQGSAKIDGTIALINAVHLLKTATPVAFDPARFIA